jgi:heme exporter protein D
MQLGPHAAFIIAAYAVAALAIALLIAWVIADHRSQLRLLTELEARGIKRRADTRPR